MFTGGMLVLGVANWLFVGEVFSGNREYGAKTLVEVIYLVMWFIIFTIAFLATDLPDDNTEENHQ